ncbi:MAG: HigA family addiction module antitoxin [Terriglobales bacterium]
MLPKFRLATHPGTILQEDFLYPLGLTQAKLARALRIPLNRVNEVVRGKRGITPQSALLLAEYFENSPEFWMNLQMAHDLSRAREVLRKRPSRVAARPKARMGRAQGAD